MTEGVILPADVMMRAIRSGIAAMALPLVAAGAWAQSSTPAPPPASPPGSWSTASVAFSIPAQPLESALVSYSLQSGVQLLFDTGVVAGKRSRPVAGRYPPQQALQLLLGDTGLRARYSEAAAVTLAPVDDATHATLGIGTLHVEASRVIGGGISYSAFAERVRDAVIASLKTDSETAYGRYDVTLRLWLSPEGAVLRVEQLGSTGLAARDRAIATVVQRVQLREPPPAELPQPITLAFHAEPAAHGR